MATNGRAIYIRAGKVKEIHVGDILHVHVAVKSMEEERISYDTEDENDMDHCSKQYFTSIRKGVQICLVLDAGKIIAHKKIGVHCCFYRKQTKIG